MKCKMFQLHLVVFPSALICIDTYMNKNLSIHTFMFLHKYNGYELEMCMKISNYVTVSIFHLSSSVLYASFQRIIPTISAKCTCCKRPDHNTTTYYFLSFQFT